MSSSKRGSDGSISKMSWTLPIPRDTTPEVARRQREWWLGLTPAQRYAYVNERKARARQVRETMIRKLHPGASDAELDAIWVGEVYKDDLDPAFLRAAQEFIRTRDERPATGP